MTRRLWLLLTLLGTVSVLGTPTFAAEPQDNLRLTLPPVGYAVVGSEMSVYFDHLILSKNSDDLRFVVTSDLGTTEAKRWTVTPTEQQVGTHQWQVEVFRGDQSLAKGEMIWHVSPAQVKQSKEITILIVGDSLTHATVYPNSLASRLDESGAVKWTMLGSHRPASAAKGVAHEGYGGWTWQRFIHLYNPNPAPTKTRHTSPFVFLEGETPKLNIARYFEETCAGQTPDYIIFMLGINDCFRADASSVDKTDLSVTPMLEHAEVLLKAFHEAATKAQLGICLTTPGNSRDGAFVANYKDAYSRWGWKQIQHRVVERQLEQFAGADSQRKFIDVIPTQLNLDPVAGYPVDNAVHPNPAGYQQIGATIHAWLMSRLTAND